MTEKSQNKNTSTIFHNLWRNFTQIHEQNIPNPWKEMSPIPFCILANSLAELDKGYIKYEEHITVLVDIGKSIFSDFLNEKGEQLNKERYWASVFNELLTHEYHYIIEIMKANKGNYKFISDLSALEDNVAEPAMMGEKMVKFDRMFRPSGKFILENKIEFV